jgi:AraC family transcriptional regulator
VPTPERTSAAAFARYTADRPLQDSAALHWDGLFVRRYRFPCLVERFLVPATPEPLISCGLAGSAEFQEREVSGQWITRRIGPDHIFVTRSTTPYEVEHTSEPGEELETVQIHVAVEPFLAALEEAHPGKAHTMEIADFFGYDPALASLCRMAAQMLAERVPGSSQRVQVLTHLFAAYLAEKYAEAAAEKPDFRSGLPVWQLRKVQDHVHGHLAEELDVEQLAEVAGLSPAHFSRVFKQATGLSPLQYVTRQRVTLAQQLIRETSRSLIEIGLEVGYESPSHFAKIFRQVTGVTPTAFRKDL